MTTTSHNLVLENSSWGLLMLDLDLEGLRNRGGESAAVPAVGSSMRRAVEIGPGKDE